MTHVAQKEFRACRANTKRLRASGRREAGVWPPETATALSSPKGAEAGRLCGSDAAPRPAREWPTRRRCVAFGNGEGFVVAKGAEAGRLRGVRASGRPDAFPVVQWGRGSSVFCGPPRARARSAQRAGSRGIGILTEIVRHRQTVSPNDKMPPQMITFPYVLSTGRIGETFF